MRATPCLAVLLAASACATEQAARTETASARPAARSSGYEVREARDEATDPDGMTVALEHGFLGQEEAEEAIRTRWRTLTRCYDEAGPARDFAGGTVRLRFSVDARGRAADVRVSASQLGSYEVERCLVERGREIVFPRPQGGGTTFEYTLEFRSTGERPVIDLPPTEVAPHVGELLPRVLSECRGLGVDSLEATIYIEPRGTVRSVGFASPAAIEPEAARCVSGVIRTWTVPLEAIRGRALGRVTLSLRDQDVLAAAHAPRPTPAARGGRGKAARR